MEREKITKKNESVLSKAGQGEGELEKTDSFFCIGYFFTYHTPKLSCNAGMACVR